MEENKPALPDPSSPPKPGDSHPARRFYRPLITPDRKPPAEGELPNVAPAAAYL
jgi:hypothetical protein